MCTIPFTPYFNTPESLDEERLRIINFQIAQLEEERRQIYSRQAQRRLPVWPSPNPWPLIPPHPIIWGPVLPNQNYPPKVDDIIRKIPK